VNPARIEAPVAKVRPLSPVELRSDEYRQAVAAVTAEIGPRPGIRSLNCASGTERSPGYSQPGDAKKLTTWFDQFDAAQAWDRAVAAKCRQMFPIDATRALQVVRS
jgi:hypothetical protein